MQEKLKRKTAIRMIGNNMTGMRRIVAIVQDEGYLEAKRYSLGVESSLKRREKVVNEVTVDPVIVVYAGRSLSAIETRKEG